jgi:hypothetical protein
MVGLCKEICYISFKNVLRMNMHHPLDEFCSHIPGEIFLPFLNVVWIWRISSLTVC